MLNLDDKTISAVLEVALDRMLIALPDDDDPNLTIYTPTLKAVVKRHNDLDVFAVSRRDSGPLVVSGNGANAFQALEKAILAIIAASGMKLPRAA